MKNVPVGQNTKGIGGKEHGMGLSGARGVQSKPVPTRSNGACLKGQNHGNSVCADKPGKGSKY